MPYTSKVQIDPETGDAIIEIPDGLCEELSLNPGDVLVYWVDEKGSIIMKKREKNLYRVVVRSTVELHVLVEANNEDEAFEIAKDADDYHQEHSELSLKELKKVTREEAKAFVAASENYHMSVDSLIDKMIARKE